MNKKILKALYKEACSTDQYRLQMTGVHFEKERCYATDTHILVIYNDGSEKFDGKTIDFDGVEIKGKYPDVDRVIPKGEVPNPISINFRQLRRACSWWKSRSESHCNDSVVIKNQAFNIVSLCRFLSVFEAAEEIGEMKFFLNETNRPGLAESTSLKAIIMPSTISDEGLIDEPQMPGTMSILSYANLINTFAIESSRPKEEAPAPMSWL